MIPGLPQEIVQGSDEEGATRMKRMIYITDSMTSSELDSDGSLFMDFGKDGKPVALTWRVARVARGSGTSVREVEELLCQYRMMANNKVTPENFLCHTSCTSAGNMRIWS